MPAVPYIIQGGAQVVGAKIAADAQGKSADKQAEAIQKGIDLQGRMYDQDRADAAPYRGLGAGAVGNLAYLGGINLPPAEATPAANPNAVPKMTLSTLGAPSNALYSQPLQQTVDKVNYANDQMNSGKLGPTTKVTKNGVTRVIPKSLLDQARASGYQEVAG